MSNINTEIRQILMSYDDFGNLFGEALREKYICLLLKRKEGKKGNNFKFCNFLIKNTKSLNQKHILFKVKTKSTFGIHDFFS